MRRTSKKRKYTEDVVLNKIFKEISEENIIANTYEDNLIKQYREKDASEKKQRYINILKFSAILFVMLILIFTYYNDLPPNTQNLAIKNVTFTPIHQPKIKKTNISLNIEPVRNNIKITHKEIIPKPIKKQVITEREIAKKMLLQQMQN